MKLQLLHGGNEMLTGGQKKNNNNNSTSAKSTTPIDQTKNLDDEAVGKLDYSDLHCIIMAAFEGGCKQQQVYRALANNYASLMCSFEMTIKPDKKSIASSIFKQNKHGQKEYCFTNRNANGYS